jgi:hypothetical protein
MMLHIRLRDLPALLLAALLASLVRLIARVRGRPNPFPPEDAI